ncbi:hypothetical protein AURDEDRAFT_111396 [Auricularia subglabra TFB-10046 SS5]|nr:hypothetical protein AURDEDRAFT_111396 [Auricularia subglabra TFB-10046 SS5]
MPASDRPPVAADEPHQPLSPPKASGPSGFAAAGPSNPGKNTTHQGGRQRKKPPTKANARLNINTIAPLRLTEGKSMLEQGTLVWAKMQSFPWFPAIVFEENDVEVPPKVRASKTVRAVKENHHLVRFSSANPTWGYIQASGIQMLGDDLEADKLILEKQRYNKGNKERKEIAEAYRVTLAQMAPDGYEPSVDEEPEPTPDAQTMQHEISQNNMATTVP